MPVEHGGVDHTRHHHHPKSCIHTAAKPVLFACFFLVFLAFFLASGSGRYSETAVNVGLSSHNPPGLEYLLPEEGEDVMLSGPPNITAMFEDMVELNSHTSNFFGDPELLKIYKFLYGYTSQDLPKYFTPTDNPLPCPAIPPNLVGSIRVFQDHFPFGQLNLMDFHVSSGGSYSPSECKARQTVAIIIPYRLRHLAILLLNLHPFLQKQQIEYTIFVVNQVEGSKFNRAMLMNIGFMEAAKRKNYDCMIFHDVDLLPENDRNFYLCPANDARHMSVAIDKFNYQLPYADILGGIVAIRSDLFLKINGYSNQFFGWGGEDDDFSTRCRRKGLKIVRYPNKIARYKMISHDRDSGNEVNPQRFKMLKTTPNRQPNDGLNSLTYKLESIVEEPLYTQINVAISQADVLNAKPRAIPQLPFQKSTVTPGHKGNRMNF